MIEDHLTSTDVPDNGVIKLLNKTFYRDYFGESPLKNYSYGLAFVGV